ncbi:MAG: glycine cleavage system aminomethyltransferase GcvT [Hyphomicrobiales bacterium]|nr:glycine cleavage system aminomethyltransferase GcvT [Hyphomicrobiales bacterium]
MAASDPSSQKNELHQTPLNALHVELGAKMVPFAGYDMPVSYPDGLIKEHQHTRAAAGLFDVSHMGQAVLRGRTYADAAAALEALVPGEVAGLKPGRIRYTQLLNEHGGILDDLMATRIAGESGREDCLFLVVNAACKSADYAYISGHLPEGVLLEPLQDRVLIALQGPKAAAVLAKAVPDIAAMPFMSSKPATMSGVNVRISRCGYTGEDGFEISLPENSAEKIARELLADEDVKPVGLGARDTLRLEAGLCLYGHDIDAPTSPVAGVLEWSIGKRRREEGGFPGAERILQELNGAPERRLVGLTLDGRAPAREGCEIAGPDGEIVGRVTSGSFAPSLGKPVALGYVPPSLSEPGAPLSIIIRGKPNPAVVTALPFVSHNYYRKTKSGTSNG